MYDRILFPTDGSPGAKAAMNQTIDLASLCGATVHVLYVADSENEVSHMVMRDDDTGFSGMVKPDEIERESGMTETGSGRMDELEAAGTKLVAAAADVFADHDVETVTSVRRGNPYRAIIDYAEDADVDLVVMPTHGRRGIDRFLLGSVTEKVVRSADVPVLTVRLQEGSEDS
ncbi:MULTISPECIES: universal stress protein [Haloarcula]|uniref:Universal stress protein UspA n=1 Tax=Haloarcula pellucida TaxID=1427151 RepID=A0A830GGT9_9EURY|nr:MULTISPECIES: universal stress protein [Halomicroarcula]MBX0346980.1 universal stress protein [Halomicroarcula pellucida]MDS0277145.1 universal stress protein [Halomicroarcula sp. S1AR25-4]GGN86385.1 universal stress protein UspA [Halomicroarcula pellucida]